MSRLVAMLALLALVAPSALAAPSAPSARSDWTIRWGGGAPAPTSSVCPLPDADRDGHVDLVMRVHVAPGVLRVEARAGPDFRRVLWTQDAPADASLVCGARPTLRSAMGVVTLLERVVHWHSAATRPPPNATPTIPDIGDFDHDGHNDSIAQPSPSNATVLSGGDGAAIHNESAAQGGLAALPFDPAAGEILVVREPAPGAPLDARALDANGTRWTTQLPPSAAPANVARNSTTGAPTGFEDVTGDGIPDVLTRSSGPQGERIELVDGASGAQVWSAPIAPGSTVRTLPTDGRGRDVVVGSPPSAGQPTITITRYDGATGAPRWISRAPAAPTTNAEAPDVEPAPPGDNDTRGPILVSAPDGGPNGTASAYALDPETGAPIWSNTTNPRGPPAPRLETQSLAPLPPIIVNKPLWIVPLMAGAGLCASIVVMSRKK